MTLKNKIHNDEEMEQNEGKLKTRMNEQTKINLSPKKLNKYSYIVEKKECFAFNFSAHVIH